MTEDEANFSYLDISPLPPSHLFSAYLITSNIRPSILAPLVPATKESQVSLFCNLGLRLTPVVMNGWGCSGSQLSPRHWEITQHTMNTCLNGTGLNKKSPFHRKTRASAQKSLLWLPTEPHRLSGRGRLARALSPEDVSSSPHLYSFQQQPWKHIGLWNLSSLAYRCGNWISVRGEQLSVRPDNQWWTGTGVCVWTPRPALCKSFWANSAQAYLQVFLVMSLFCLQLSTHRWTSDCCYAREVEVPKHSSIWAAQWSADLTSRQRLPVGLGWGQDLCSCQQSLFLETYFRT